MNSLASLHLVGLVTFTATVGSTPTLTLCLESVRHSWVSETGFITAEAES